MKKFLLLLALLVPMLAFTGCGGDDEPDTPENPDTPTKPDVPKITNQALTGVWESDDKFFSFTEDGFYCTHITDKFIASGSYSISNDVVKCNNAYYDTELLFSVSVLNTKTIKGKINYVDFEGNPTEISVDFKKSDKAPTPKESVLIGKTYSSLGAYTDGSGMFDDVYNFTLFNTATITRTKKSGLKDSKVKNLHYIYLAPNLYYQQFKPQTAGLSSFYSKCNNGEVIKKKVTITNGQITDIE